METKENIEIAEKKSANFIEQFIEKDLAEGKTEVAYRHAFRLSPTAICI